MARMGTLQRMRVWFNLGFPLDVDLESVDDAVAAVNMKTLRGYCSCFIPLAVICAAVCSTQTSNYLEAIAPFFLAIAFFLMANAYARKLSSKDAGYVEKSRILAILFCSVIFALAFFYDSVVYADSSNMMSCMAFCVVCPLFDEKPVYMVPFTVIALAVSAVLTVVFPMNAAVENLFVMCMAGVLGIVISWIKSRNAYTAFIEAKKELEISAQMSRSQVMVSQLKPHFVSNVLSTIYVLCDQDVGKAKYTIDKFNTYMRNNIDAVDSSDPIVFERELDHIKNYVALEKVRFGDKLTVEYNIGPEDFAVLPLMVQPLVENAIKHGVGNKRGGGTVTISTSEDANNYYVTVQDDGCGIDALCINQVDTPQDGRTHVGLHNTKSRVREMLGGELMFLSDAELGTTVTVMVPKEASAMALREVD